MEFIKWLDAYDGAIIAIGTVAVAVATAVLVGVTIYYARVTRKMQLNAQKPAVGICFDPSTGASATYTSYVDFYVENTGAGPAYNMEFNTNNTSLGKIPFIQSGIGYLPPGQQRWDRLNFTSDQDFPQLMQKPLEIAVIYKDSRGTTYENRFSLNLREYVES